MYSSSKWIRLIKGGVGELNCTNPRTHTTRTYVKLQRLIFMANVLPIAIFCSPFSEDRWYEMTARTIDLPRLEVSCGETGRELRVRVA